ncbi:hypothetical protein TNCT_431681 [Trichonephila clavata]|uniref:Uncharacterized protein n=1 Tax=Trichonephila clavata TaxID=2740835 RepID=A0A8X6HM99_TRICU|nr:hypothetical protein TNCT_431681 [Trichonephila clavata]
MSEMMHSLLSVWCEDLGRLLLLRHQKARNGDSATDTQSTEPSKMHQTLPKTLPPGPQNAADYAQQKTTKKSIYGYSEKQRRAHSQRHLPCNGGDTTSSAHKSYSLT